MKSWWNVFVQVEPGYAVVSSRFEHIIDHMYLFIR